MYTYGPFDLKQSVLTFFYVPQRGFIVLFLVFFILSNFVPNLRKRVFSVCRGWDGRTGYGPTYQENYNRAKIDRPLSNGVF